MRHAISPSWISRGVVTAATAGLLIAGAAPAFADDDTQNAAKGPKNVILLIGDGMGYNHIDNASLFETGTAQGQVRTTAKGVSEIGGPDAQVFQGWDQAAMTSYPVGGEYDPEKAWTDFDYVKDGATDSAAAGTAMATGVKTVNGALGLDKDGNAPENLTERAIALGKAAGVVSSVPFSHATPAGFVAHVESRNDYQLIANQMINSDLDVILGAGHPLYNDSNEPLDEASYGYISEKDHNRLKDGQTDWTYIEEKADFERHTTGDTPDKLFGIAQVASTLQQGRQVADVAGDDYTNPDEVAHEGLPYETPLNAGVPSLRTMTSAALNVLDENENGFFVMIEGGAIDWSGHANETARNIEEVKDFNGAVAAAVEWVEENSSWDETQIIVTADHETGYLAGPESGGSIWTPMSGTTGELPTVEWYSGDHTNMLVPIFSKGAGTEELLSRATGKDPVRGAYLDNTDIANYLLDELWAVPSVGGGDIPVTAEIPGLGGGDDDDDNAGPGSLVLSVADGGVQLDNARNAGDRLRLTGTLPGVSVTDTRAGSAGWAVTGQSSDLSADTAVVRASNLGWAPFVAAGAATPGAEVAPELAGGQGLAAPATLGTSSADAQRGTATLAADMRLEVPVDTKAGSYTGGVTVSLFPQD